MQEVHGAEGSEARIYRLDSGLMLEFLRRLKARVAFVVSDGHEGLREAVTELLTDVAWQRCYVHFLRNALDHLPRKADDNCLRNCAGPTSGAT